MNKPLISICVTAYNAEKHISESIDSILNQSYKPMEIIVVNDGSTDRTGEILKTYAKKGIKVIEQENQGQCAAANRAYKEAKGEYIKFFDADDILSENFIEHQVSLLNGRADYIASAAWGRFYNDDLSTFKLNPEPVWKDMKPIDWLVESLWNGPNMMQCALWLIPRKVLEKSGLWNEKLSLINDFDFFIRVILASEHILFSKESILKYRSGLGNTLSATKSRKAMASACLSIQLGCESILNYEDTERTRKVCADCYQLWTYNTYPEFPDLSKKMHDKANTLGGSQLSFPAGGITKKLVKLFGWKATKFLKSKLKLA